MRSAIRTDLTLDYLKNYAVMHCSAHFTNKNHRQPAWWLRALTPALRRWRQVGGYKFGTSLVYKVAAHLTPQANRGYILRAALMQTDKRTSNKQRYFGIFFKEMTLFMCI